MFELNQPLLIDILGHAGGSLIFAIFLVLLFRGRGWPGHGRNLPAVAAGLSLGWNLGSLIVLVCPRLPPLALNVLLTLSFSCLSLLPAVLLHISVRKSRPVLVGCGYTLSAIAVGMHLRELRGSNPPLHQAALLIITIGFLILTGAAVADALIRGGPARGSRGARIAASMCLALFAISFVHFGTGHSSHAWSSELIIHPAGIPLALFVLLQDYRFVMLDAVVRFLANALLAAGLTWLVIAATFRLALAERSARDPLSEALLFISVCSFLVLFAWLRNRVQAWLTHVVFRQDAVSSLAARLKDSPVFGAEQPYLDWAAATTAAAVKTQNYALTELASVPAAADLRTPVAAELAMGDPGGEWGWAEAVIPVRLGPGASKLILLGRRHGGQPYLGEDFKALARAAAEISERVEAIRQEEMNRLVSQAELRALQSQINPHFLFNALNTLYGTIPREAAGARRLVLNLADIFRYFLQSDKTFVPLAEEMQIVRAYLEVEQLRLGERIAVEIDIDPAAITVPIPVLSIQPLVENAIKHGIAHRPEPGCLRIRAAAQPDGLLVSVQNDAAAGAAAVAGPGVGLQNVRRRLEICYGPSAELRLTFGAQATVAELRIPVGAQAGVERVSIRR